MGEDECSIGNDETRIFILSSLASNKMNNVPCVLCNAVLAVYDRYPLIDGTFFLSPRQQSRSCIQVSTASGSPKIAPLSLFLCKNKRDSASITCYRSIN